jgi:hypothetical protein
MAFHCAGLAAQLYQSGLFGLVALDLDGAAADWNRKTRENGRGGPLGKIFLRRAKILSRASNAFMDGQIFAPAIGV